MVVLIVASKPELSRIWARQLERMGHEVILVFSQDEAIDLLQNSAADVIVLDLMLASGSAIAVADYASYRWPQSRVVFVTNSTFFSDGSLFNHIPNAAAILPERTAPNDLAAVVDYHGRAPV
jgi:DNA-binding response OmpR family regulator